ncbi:hypothetical protein CPB84DRAFT_1688955 [Gymnopilus junonius]|uniref:F-box domain-containing protein n=1 Tax=Gymnopilus junonius TaxID=109634 RepID=A0A9P5NC58_GYMJU|nr:hypothetical protein CPB84DRAFT_1688955 [Gymnopilus junonius]
MKDVLTPVATPFTLSNTLDTPSRLGSNHYFTSSHHLSAQVCAQGPEEAASLQHRPGKSAIDAIPSELLSLILEAGYFNHDEDFTHDNEFRSLLSQISRRFREVAFSTPSVWSVIRLSRGNVEGEVHRLPAYLERSKDYPLDVHLSAFWDMDMTDDIMNQLLRHSKRWRRLCIVAFNPYIFSHLQHAQASNLEDLELAFYSHQRRASLPSPVFDSYTPRLSRLCLRNINLDDLDVSLRELKTLEIRGYCNWPSASRLTEMIGGSKSLEELILFVKPGQTLEQLSEESDNHHAQVLLPNVRLFEMFTSEWLSSDISSLIQTFSCPKLESFALREGSGASSSRLAKTIMSYTTSTHLAKNSRLFYPLGEPLFDGLPNHLFVHSANLSHARQAFCASTITSLEIRQVSLPPYDMMRTTFTSLVNLKYLFLLGIYPNEAFMQILDNIEPEYFQETTIAEMDSTIAIPSLETLMIDFHHPTYTVLPRDYSAEFIRVFSLPSLRSLILKGLESQQWKDISNSFSNSTDRYPKLASLKLIEMADVDFHPYDTSSAFPNLRRLSLDSVPSNLFIHQLLPRSPFSSTSDPSPSTNWPHLEEIAISNDPNTSKPLLHRVITTRERIGKPLKKLCLDDNFYKNLESINWIKEHVEVAELEKVFL